MCPFCIANATMIAAAGTTSLGSMSAWVMVRLRGRQKRVAALKRRAGVLLIGLLIATPAVAAALFPSLPHAAALVGRHWRATIAAAAKNGDPSDPVQRLVAIASELVERTEQ